MLDGWEAHEVPTDATVPKDAASSMEMNFTEVSATGNIAAFGDYAAGSSHPNSAKHSCFPCIPQSTLRYLYATVHACAWAMGMS